jgi:serine/threonine protein phosphatase PrpC
MIKVTATVITSRGRGRPANEDRIGVFGWLSPVELTAPMMMQSFTVEPLVVAVADGLGGHRAGEVASEIAITRLLAEQGKLTDADALAERYQDIHANVLAAAHGRPDREGMGTTLVAVVVTDEHLLVASIGDSRAYYLERGLFEQLTTDDVTPFGDGALTQVVGGAVVQPVQPHVSTIPIDRALRVLLCSDGLHSYLPGAVLRELAVPADAYRVVDGLNEAVYQAGAPDNVSICLVDVEPMPHVQEETDATATAP